MPESADILPALIRNLLDPACYDHRVTGRIRHLETHISNLLLTGGYAYKIKKPLNLGFLDFSTLDRRLNACTEEVRLNRRLAPHIYLGVVPISGSPDAPRINGSGTPFEYAVKMREFAPEATLDRLDEQGLLSEAHIEAIAQTLARFHLHGCAQAPAESPWGTPPTIWQPIAQNFAHVAPLLVDDASRAELDAVRAWSEAEHARLSQLIAARKRDGFVRECHGDLHLGNLAWVDDRLLVFDCLEFSPALRWIDIQSEIAFCYMDLVERGHADWAWLFINRWLEQTGDYAGLALLRFYAVYRAMVRVKVNVLRAEQLAGAARVAALAAARSVLDLATALTQPRIARLDITHGLSGSGKTTATTRLMQTPGAIRLRSDVERKRLAGLDALAKSGSGVGRALYGEDATRRTYRHLAALASGLLDAGWPVVVDATFTLRWQRDLLRETARSRRISFRILDFAAPLATLEARIVGRARAGRDASEADLAVLTHQVSSEEPLGDDELGEVSAVHASAQER
jgi:hypothetical protein